MNDEIESITPMSDRPHPRTIAAEAIATYQAMRNGYQPQKPYGMTQKDIDGTGSRETEAFTRRAVKFHKASWLRKIRNLF